MNLRAATFVMIGLLLNRPGSLAAQTGTAERGVVRDLLTSARSHLNDLKFREADSVARAVLDYPQLRRAERIQALQIDAGALFPEQGTAQQRDATIDILRRLVKLAPAAPLPREVSWQGLDSLYQTVHKQTFGVSAAPRSSYMLTGPQEKGAIDVATSRSAHFLLIGREGKLGREIVLDSLTTADRGTLRFSLLSNAKPIFRAGPIELLVKAVDSTWNDTLVVQFDAFADSPPLELVPVVARFDSTKILPEVTKPRRAGGIVGGLVVAAATFLAAQVIRESSFKSAVPRDGRAGSLGIVIGIGTGAGVWLLDKGAPIPKNIQANRDLLKNFGDESTKAKAENEKRIANYRAELRIDPEPK